MNTIQKQVKSYLAGKSSKIVDFCARLVQTPSVNGLHDERAVAELIAAEARRLGLPHVQLAGDNPQRPNVIAGTAETGSTGLLLVGHLDTVPAGNPDRWSHPPFSGRQIDGKLFGRGAIDNKGGIAAALYALAALSSIKEALPHGQVQFIGVPDEESGATGTLGVKYLRRQHLLNAKGAIYVYPGREEIPLGHRGVTRFKLIAHGLAAHTGISGQLNQPSPGQSAVTAMAEALLRLEQLELPVSQTEYFDRFRAVINAGTVINGGVNINIVPDRCETLVDVRTIPEFDRLQAEEAIKQAIATVGNHRPGIAFDLELLTCLPPAISDTSAPLFDIIQYAARTITGFLPAKTVCGPANEGYLFIKHSIPIVCGFGPTGANAHAINEYVEVSSLVDAALIYCLTAMEMDRNLAG